MAPQNATEQLHALPFWNDLTREEQLAAEGSIYVRTCEAGSLIHAGDQECLGLIFVCSGRIRTYLFSPEGREITLYRLKKGDTDVLSASCVVNQITFDTQMVAETNCRLLVLPAHLLSQLRDNNLRIRSFIYEQLTERFSDVMWTMQQMLFLRLDERLAGYLISESDGADSIKATHEQIAQAINSTREVVTRMLKTFKSEKLVALNRGEIVILNREGLEALAGS